MLRDRPFLRIPPFPGHRAPPLAVTGASTVDGAELVEALRRERVGGQFWGARPDIPDGVVRILAPVSQDELAAMLAFDSMPVAVLDRPGLRVPSGLCVLDHGSDPWHLAGSGAEIWASADHELSLVAALSGAALRQFGTGAFADCRADPAAAAAAAIGGWAYACPFGTAPYSALDAIAQLGEWRRLIDNNRRIAAVAGAARWKRVTLDPLLWNGEARVRHVTRRPADLRPGNCLAIWKSRAPKKLLADLDGSGVPVAEIEDGFIRSVGLGANCVPPLSVIVDFSGIYFDPFTASDLEYTIKHSTISSALCQRASSLRSRLVQSSISKYGQGGTGSPRPASVRRQVLVTGQVEDDRSILTGGMGKTNLELLQRARELEPEAHIIYKPHPDVEAGHRKGNIPRAEALHYADEVASDASITELLETVDAVHVITSLAGFEALLRDKPVTTHGVPFYAGWGLTRDLAPVPQRRTRRRSLDELVAATLILYPRYLDPVTRLPCSPEVLIGRIAAGQARITTPLIKLREIQGRLRRVLQRLVGGGA